MSLTGRALLVLLILLSVISLVVVLADWHRASWPHWVKNVVRFTLLGVNQLTAVALVFVLANDAGGFYSSWSDLLGLSNTGVTRHSVHRLAQPGPTSRLRGMTNDAFASPGQRTHRGQLVSLTLDGVASGLRVPLDLYLPPQYFQPAFARRRFPVVEVLGGNTRQPRYRDPVRTAHLYLDLLRTRHARPAVLVMMNSSLGRHRRQPCTTAPGGPQPQAFLDTDLPLTLTKTYRVRPLGWGVLGVASGGYCAARLSLLDPNVFYAGAAIDGYLTPPHTASASGLRRTASTQHDPVVADLDNLLWRLHNMPVPPARILTLTTRDAAPSVVRQVSALQALARSPLRLTVPARRPSSSLAGQRTALSWLTNHLPTPTPVLGRPKSRG
ncbi:alpha/beta hydrolase-fold protein [Flexivirga caeni]|uniref:Esterase n=1 Tax=Flexivirga caeni TaxID=2294115 RepID=A0A3M9MCP3_9MICO|nr:alpha/beta hydrolase-fold protein [Flexivirga caeni]RNI22927.1 hypothetical protein EFY87_08975 [Flexivirga caeni]